MKWVYFVMEVHQIMQTKVKMKDGACKQGLLHLIICIIADSIEAGVLLY